MRSRFALATDLRFAIIQKESTTVDTIDTTARTTHISARVLPFLTLFDIFFTENLLSKAQKALHYQRETSILGIN